MKYFILMLTVLLAFPQTVFAGFLNKDDLKGISYVANPVSDQQKLDIYLPLKKSEGLKPVHVFVHGGAWTLGSRGAVKRRDARPYLSEDIIVVSVGYRLSPQYQYPANIEDLAAAMRWITDNIEQYGGDPKNIVLSGHSAGAHLVALLATNPKYLTAQRLPLTMFKSVVAVDTATFDLTQKQQGKGQRVIGKMRNKAFGTDEAVLKDASPTIQAQNTNAFSSQVLFVSDERPDAVANTNDFYTALNKAGHVVHQYVISGGVSHSEMKDAIFDQKHQIFKTIVSMLKN